MENTAADRIISIADAQKAYFRTGKTLDVKFRRNMLDRFAKALDKWEAKLCDALWEDLHKSYEEAYLTFKSLYKFKDSQTRANTILREHPSVAQVGDIICFGKYEQDNNKSNGMEEIEWKVLQKDENGKMLLISKYALDCRNYHSSPKQVTWEESEIRGWLNTDFYATAFSSSEKSSIKTTTLENTGNSDFKVNGGNKTSDKVFLLSIDEAKSYFPKNIDRICIATKSAEIKGSELDGITRACRWWLRSPGSTLYSAASVKLDGFILDLGPPVSIDKAFIRPAIWIELK